MSPEEYENEIAVLHLRERLRNAEVARLTSELAEARKNEARYLLLRKPHEEFDLSYCKQGDEAWEYIFYDDLDAAIDAAIDAARSAGGEG